VLVGMHACVVEAVTNDGDGPSLDVVLFALAGNYENRDQNLT